jgi:acetyl esterase
MPLDPAAAALLAQIEEAGLPPLNEMSPVDARVAAEAFIELAGPGESVADVTERKIPGRDRDILVRIYTPSAGDDSTPLPSVVYFHGGGWVIGTLDSTDAICRMLANRAACKVVSVDYRLAPESKFPEAIDDCYAALNWVRNNADELGVDPDRLAVSGDSAGGNLAAALAIKARDEGGPALRFQLLVYPVTDHRFDTVSYRDNGEGYLLTTDMMRWFWDHYLGPSTDDDHHLVSPLRAEDLTGLPPAMVITAEYDPLRDEGEAYAARLAEAGVPVTHKRYDGQIHAFWQMPGLFPAAYQAADDAAAELCKALAVTSATT